MNRDERLHVRIQGSIKRLAEKRAEALGFSLSEYVRYLIVIQPPETTVGGRDEKKDKKDRS